MYARWLYTGRPQSKRRRGESTWRDDDHPVPEHAPLVATIHDLAFLHDPEHFTRWGRLLFNRSLAVLRDRAAAVLCSSMATMDDCAHAGIDADRLRHVPLGVRVSPASMLDVERVRHEHQLPGRYLLFVGTVEPRRTSFGWWRPSGGCEPIELVIVRVTRMGRRAPGRPWQRAHPLPRLRPRC